MSKTEHDSIKESTNRCKLQYRQNSCYPKGNYCIRKKQLLPSKNNCSTENTVVKP